MLSSVANALRALEYLADEGDVGISELSRHLEVTVGTAHRLISTLVETGFAERDPQTRRYRPTAHLVVLAERVRQHLNVGQLIHQELAALAAEVRETVNLGVLDGAEVLYIDKVVSDRPFGIEARTGSRLPLHRTALGKVLIAGLQSAAREELIRSIPRERVELDAPPPPSAQAFRRDLELVRTRGYAEDLGEYLPDVCCIASPIEGPDSRVIAAISITVPRSRFSRIEPHLLDRITVAAAAISERLNNLGVTDLTALRSSGFE